MTPGEHRDDEILRRDVSPEDPPAEQADVNRSTEIPDEPFTVEGGGVGAEGDGPGEDEPALARAERERDEYLDALRRERAEFENFRRRTTKERMDALDRGAEQLVGNLLGVLDSFGLALEAAEKSGDEQLHKGVEMVFAQLMDALSSSGLRRVDETRVPFDPTIHEAMLQVDAAESLGHEVDESLVVEVLRPGYRFKDRVLRPASVKVAR